MSVVGWFRLAAGSSLIGVGTVFALHVFEETPRGFFGFYHERLEYFGFGYDDITMFPIPVAFLGRIALTFALLLIGYRLLKRADHGD